MRVENRSRISSSDAARIAAIASAVVVLLLFSWWTRSLLITTFLAYLFSLPLAWIADYFQEKRVPRSVSILGTVAATAGLLTLLGFLLAPPLREQTRELKQRLPAAMDKIEEWLRKSPVTLIDDGAQQQAQNPEQTQTNPPAAQQQQQQRGIEKPQLDRQAAQSSRPEDSRNQQPAGGAQPQSQMASSAGAAEQESGSSREAEPAMTSLRGFLSRQLSGVTQLLFPFVSTTFAIIGGILLVLVLAIYFAIDPRLYQQGVLQLVPEARRDAAKEVLSEIADALRRWLVTRAVAMVAVGIITAGLLSLIGIRAALALGVIAAILEFIPFFGPILAAVPAIAVAIVDSPDKALWTIGAFLLIQQIEGNIISPLLLKKRIDIPPALTVLAVSAMGIIFGVLGVLVAEPVVVALLVGFKAVRNGDSA